MSEQMLHSTCTHCDTVNIISRLHVGALNCSQCGAPLKPPVKTNPSISGEPYRPIQLVYNPVAMAMCSTDGYAFCDTAMPFIMNH